MNNSNSIKYLCIILLSIGSLRCSTQSTILWQITKPNTNDTSYLVGTFHQLGNSFVDSFPAITQSLFHSDLAIFESIDNSDRLLILLNSRPDNFEYKKTLKKSDIVFLEEYSKNWAVHVCKLQPIELLIKLQQEYIKSHCGTIKPNDTFRHFDKYLIHLSELNKIPILGLETDSMQTKDINESAVNFEWKIAKKHIHKILSQIRNPKMNPTICKNAIDYMTFSFNYQFNIACGDSNLIIRNEKWLPVIIDNINSKKTFIAVGLLHLYGNCGLISKIIENGYKIEPLKL
ncbi:MAG: TraB/GumN family protein [Vicingaceae bacterium]|nr:MAG: TraB/GumN family protein [Vicingaceae bacterium]